MKLLNLRWIVLIGFLVGSVLAVDLAANQPVKKYNAAQLFDFIANTSPLLISQSWNDGLAPRERWNKKMKENGLEYVSSDTWNIADQTGVLRASALFLNDKVIFILRFFPVDRNPIPAPILSALMSKAESTSTEEASTIELNFKSILSSTNEHLVSKSEYMQIQLQGGILLRQSKYVECTVRKKE